MKKLIAVLLLILVSGAWMVSNAQKVSFIDSDVIINQLPETAVIKKNLEDLQKLYVDTLTAKETDIKTKADAFKAKYEDAQKQMETGKLTQEQIKALETELGAMQEEVQRLDQEYALYKQNVQYAIVEEKEKMMKPVREKVFKAVEDLAKELKYNLVLDKASGALIFGDKDIDITFKVLDKLK